MKKWLCISLLYLNTNHILYAQANQQLNNLSSVAVNTSLLPGSSSIDLGSSGTDQQFRNIYVKDNSNNIVMYYVNKIFLHINGGISPGGDYPEGIFLGIDAGKNASSLNNGCVGIGNGSLQSMVMGNHNTAFGWRSLFNMDGNSADQGDKNTMIGSRAGESVATGSENTGIGHNVFYKGSSGSIITGSHNVGVGGGYILKTLTSGNSNTVLGYGSGTTITTGSNNIIIGDVQETHFTNYGLNIGGTIYGDLQNDKISIGNSDPSISSMFNVGTSDQFQVSSTGIIPKYRNINTVNNGVAAEYAKVDLTNQSTSINATTLYSVPADGSGMYRINYQLRVTTAAGSAAALNFKIEYTDKDDNQVITIPPSNIDFINSTTSNSITTGIISGSLVVNAKESTDIKYKTNYATSGTPSMQYTVHVVLEAL